MLLILSVPVVQVFERMANILILARWSERAGSLCWLIVKSQWWIPILLKVELGRWWSWNDGTCRIHCTVVDRAFVFPVHVLVLGGRGRGLRRTHLMRLRKAEWRKSW